MSGHHPASTSSLAGCTSFFSRCDGLTAALMSARILQVAGTDATTDEIKGMEERWKKKLQSKEMGLN